MGIPGWAAASGKAAWTPHRQRMTRRLTQRLFPQQADSEAAGCFTKLGGGVQGLPGQEHRSCSPGHPPQGTSLGARRALTAERDRRTCLFPALCPGN